MTRFESLAALLILLVTLLGYAVWILRRIRRGVRVLEQLGREHRLLLDAAHWHDGDRVRPAAPLRSHRRPRGAPPWDDPGPG